jgi:CRISPR/Cas system CMR subunit Cmr6 (Cas7 group RAMP superfamily)
MTVSAERTEGPIIQTILESEKKVEINMVLDIIERPYKKTEKKKINASQDENNPSQQTSVTVTAGSRLKMPCVKK